MKKNILLAISMIFLYQYASSQDSAKVTLDLLRAPSSPGANLLGFATSDIEKPSDVSAFMTSIQSAASGLAKFPSNYAVDVAPFWLTKRTTGFTTGSLNSGVFKDVFKQTFVVSMAIRNTDSADKRFDAKSTYAALGFKFDIIRGKYDKHTIDVLNSITTIQATIVKGIHEAEERIYKNDSVMVATQLRLNALIDLIGEGFDTNAKVIALQKILTDRQTKITDSLQKMQKDLPHLKTLAENFRITRIGWYWDISGGSSLQFRNNSFSDSKFYSGGLWTSFGTTTEQGMSVLFIGRYLYNPDQVYADNNAVNQTANISTLDGGSRLAFSDPDSKFLFSAEAIYRSVLTGNTLPSSWKLSLNLEYDIGRNQKLTFVFGKNFDGTTNKGGTLIAALNLLAGFGNRR